MQLSAAAIIGSENLKVKTLHFNKIQFSDAINTIKNIFLSILDAFKGQDMIYPSFFFPPTFFFLTTHCIYFNGLRMLTFKAFNRDGRFHCQVCSGTQLGITQIHNQVQGILGLMEPQS